MSINWLRPVLTGREQPAVGTFVQTPHAGVAESLTGLPFDFLCAEGEHSPFGGEVLRQFATACELHGMPLLVRVPDPTSVNCAEALDAEGLANLDDIMSVDGIDLIFVGPGDLAVSLTGTTNGEAAEVREAITSIRTRTREAGRMTGIFAGTAEGAARYSQGRSPPAVDLIILGSDLEFMGQGGSDMLSNYWDRLS